MSSPGRTVLDATAAAAVRLHDFLERRFLDDDGVLRGPDAGIRFNARVGRFLKSYTGLRWHDSLSYMQAQSYWVQSNWRLWQGTGEARYAEIAASGADAIRRLQRPDGSWEYPNPEWSGRIATVEGSFAGLALLDSYRQTEDELLLDAALAWYRCLEEVVGYRDQEQSDELAVNYFAHISSHGGGVPNNATLVVWFLAALHEVTGDTVHLARVPQLLRWVERVQLETGELPYLVGGGGTGDRTHFLCAQYNAFEFMDLAHYLELSGDRRVLETLGPLARFLSSSITERETVAYDCENERIEVPYYSLAVARALVEADRLGLPVDVDAATGVLRRTLGHQARDGSFDFYSRGNYRILRDRNDYPRPLAMMLFHLVELSGSR